MKKTILSVFVVMSFLATSCKKDRTCTCTNTLAGNATSTTSVVKYAKIKKRVAERDCVSYEETTNGQTDKFDCKLD